MTTIGHTNLVALLGAFTFALSFAVTHGRSTRHC